MIYSRRGHEEGIFRFNTTLEGQYSFVFSNMKDRVNPKTVTLAIHPGFEETAVEKASQRDEIKGMADSSGVSIDELQEFNRLIRGIYKKAENLLAEAKMSLIRQDAHNRAVDYNSRQSLYMTILEASSFMAICSFNLYHIKGILENRRII